MKWLDAYKQIDKPTFTNREASGVVGFARALFRAYSKDPKAQLSPWDWYAFALPALGWSKPGDKFKIDTKHQLQPYPFSQELRASLTTMATELDASAIPFKLLVDPRGTDSGFRKLAADAWAAMKQLGAEASAVPDMLKGTWTAQLGPQGAAAVASSASAASAAAAKPAGLPTRPPQPDLPGFDAQPVGPPIPVEDPTATPTTKNGGGGGGIILLALLAFAGKRRRGRR